MELLAKSQNHASDVDAPHGKGWGPHTLGVRTAEFRMQGFLMYFFYQSGKHERFVAPKQLDGCECEKVAT
eukprot:548513-Amphidinium_carterae.1